MTFLLRGPPDAIASTGLVHQRTRVGQVTWLGVDIGTTNLQVCRVPAGQTGMDVVVRSVRTPDAAVELQDAVRRLVAELADGEHIEGIGISGMAETGVPLDRELRPLTKLITWRDQPGVAQAEELAAELG